MSSYFDISWHSKSIKKLENIRTFTFGTHHSLIDFRLQSLKMRMNPSQDAWSDAWTGWSIREVFLINFLLFGDKSRRENDRSNMGDIADLVADSLRRILTFTIATSSHDDGIFAQFPHSASTKNVLHPNRVDLTTTIPKTQMQEVPKSNKIMNSLKKRDKSKIKL